MKTKHHRHRKAGDSAGELADVLSQAHALGDRLEHDWYGYGQLVRRIQQEKLFTQGGYKTAAACWSAELSLARAEANTYIQIVSAFTESAVVGLRPAPLGKLLVIAGLEGKPIPDDPGQYQVPVPVPGADGKVARKPMAQCSLQELDAAIDALKAPHIDDGKMPKKEADMVLGWSDNLFDYSGDEQAYVRGVYRNGQSRVLMCVLVDDFEDICASFGGGVQPPDTRKPKRPKKPARRQKPAPRKKPQRRR